MLQPLSNINLGQRIDLSYDAWTAASGATGTFVSFAGSDDVQKPTAGDFAMPIWSESNRDGTAGFSPDIAATGKVTVFYGKLRAVTDQFTGTPAVNEKLYVSATGKLTTSSAGKAVAVAICTKASHSVTYLGTVYTCIEFVTL
jgi:hypothetical protein